MICVVCSIEGWSRLRSFLERLMIGGRYLTYLFILWTEYLNIKYLHVVLYLLNFIVENVCMYDVVIEDIIW